MTEDSARTTMSWVLRIPSITFMMESGKVGITLSATVASGSDSSNETYTRLFMCCLLSKEIVEARSNFAGELGGLPRRKAIQRIAVTYQNTQRTLQGCEAGMSTGMCCTIPSPR